jgi:hypothetical protein
MDGDIFIKIRRAIGVYLSLLFIIVTLYVYFFRHFPFQAMLVSILFWVSGILISIITMKTSGEKLLLDPRNIEKQQKILGLCGIIWGICCFWLTRISNFGAMRKGTFYIGFIFFCLGGLILFFKKPPLQIKDPVGKGEAVK